jgi:polysaccharide export outer membrane protein
MNMVLLFALSLGVAGQAGQSADYVVVPRDQVTITVWNHTELSGTFDVNADGSVEFPLLGRINIGGLTLRQIEALVEKQLQNGYLKKPQVTAAIEKYRTRRVFVMGEVRSPATYEIGGDTTLVEALARAGSTTTSAGTEVLIVRAPPGGSKEPVMPDQGSGDAGVIRVNLSDLQTGNLSANVPLQDGDTIVVPKAAAVYISGYVRSPGAFVVEPGTTVLQALSLAGGISERGSPRGIKISRIVDGKKKEFKVKLTDLVLPGDTIIVSQRLF